MRVSFCHPGNDAMASYRYRAAIPAREMGAAINDPGADVLIFAKPNDQDIGHAVRAKREGRLVIADFCDMHFGLQCYTALLELADAVTCPTEWFAKFLREDHGVEAVVVPDPWEFAEAAPHCSGGRLLWFGHALNINSLQRIGHEIIGRPLKIVSNFEGSIPWSIERLQLELREADIVLMPETAPHKSANRTVEAIRQGCFVVAEPHPAINHIPGIWLGGIGKGVEWASANGEEARQRTWIAQDYIRDRFSPSTQASAWRSAIRLAQSSCTSARAPVTGAAG